MERDVYDKENLIFDGNFNSHAHVERDRSGIALFSWSTNFNSHAHVERDSGIFSQTCLRFISTHTLTWSVTSLWPVPSLTVRYFNSHAHVERDTGARKLCLMILISTHTLTWSVT